MKARYRKLIVLRNIFFVTFLLLSGVLLSAEVTIPIPEIKRGHYRYQNSDLEYKISKSDCSVSFDNSSNFGPVRDQDGVGFCWAFAGADLYGEYLCQLDRKYCGKNISVLSGMLAGKNNWKYGIDTQGDGGHILDILEGFMLTGALCEEKYWELPSMDSFFCTLFNKDKKCFRDRMFKIFTQMRNELEKSNNLLECRNKPEKLFEFISEINSLIEHRDISDEVILDFVRENNFEALSKMILVPIDCLKNNINVLDEFGPSAAYDFQVFDVLFYERDFQTDFSRPYKSEPNSRKVNEVIKGFQAGGSVAITYCSKELMKKYPFSNSLKKDHSNLLADNCGNHASVLTGIRWNDKKNRCEVKLRNSWGSGSPLSGWMDAQRVLNTVYKINYMSKKK